MVDRAPAFRFELERILQRVQSRRVSCYVARMRMTQPTSRVACAHVRQLVAVWLACVVWWSTASGARAQVPAELERALTVTRELPGCVSAPALRARTARYLVRTDQLASLTIEVDAQVPQFRVLRAGTLVAERRFTHAPTDCAERRDALALAVAIAIEQVAQEPTHEPAADSGEREAPAAPAPTRNAEPGSRSGQTISPSTAARSRDRAAKATQGAADESIADDRTLNSARAEVTGSRRAADRPLDDTRGDAQTVARGRRAGDGAADDRDETSPRSGSASPPSAADLGVAELQGSRGEERARVSLLGAGAVLFEALPAAAPAFSVGAELALLPALRIALSGLFSLPISSAFQGGSVSTQLYGAQLTACLNAAISASLLLHGCAGAVGGVIDAQGDDFALNLSDRMGWVAGLLRARLEFPATGRVAAGVYADGRLNLLRPELQASLGKEPARTRAAGWLGAALGVELIVRLQ